MPAAGPTGRGASPAAIRPTARRAIVFRAWARPAGGAGCPLNAFGTARKPDGSRGRGKACKEAKLLFLLREGCRLPDVVSVPASGLKALRQYQLKLGLPYWSVLTSLALEKARNRDGVVYATIRPSARGVLCRDVAARVAAYANALQGVFPAVTVRQANVRDA